MNTYLVCGPPDLGKRLVQTRQLRIRDASTGEVVERTGSWVDVDVVDEFPNWQIDDAVNFLMVALECDGAKAAEELTLVGGDEYGESEVHCVSERAATAIMHAAPEKLGGYNIAAEAEGHRALFVVVGA